MSQEEESALSGVISISGKPGLYKVITQTKNGLIVESVVDGRRIPVYPSDQVSSVEDISVYTQEDDVPLTEIFEKMYEATGGKESIDHKSAPEELRSTFAGIVPDYDEERVYNSDLKKLFQWFNILVRADLLGKTPVKTDDEETKEEPEKAEE